MGVVRSGPTFLGIGAAKTGTTWLAKQLDRHPEIWTTPLKEMHFFDRSPNYPSPSLLNETSALGRLLSPSAWRRHRTFRVILRSIKAALQGRPDAAKFWARMVTGTYNEDWYRGLFPDVTHYPASGEITPAYALLKDADIAQIHAMNPEMRLIFLLRNPVERSWSGIRYAVARGFLDLEIRDSAAIINALRKTEQRQSEAVSHGNYLKTVGNYLKYYAPEHICIGFYDAISLDPHGLVRAVTTFLGVSDPPAAMVDGSERVNAAPATPMPDEVQAYLSEHHADEIAELADMLGGYAEAWRSGLPEGVPLPPPGGTLAKLMKDRSAR